MVRPTSETDQKVADAAQAVAGAIAQAAAVAAEQEKSSNGVDEELAPLFISELSNLNKSIFASFNDIANTIVDFKTKIKEINYNISNNLVKNPDSPAKALIAEFQDANERLSTSFNSNHLDYPNGSLSSHSNGLHGNSNSNDNHNNTNNGNNNDSSSFLDEEIPEIDLNPRAKVVHDLWVEWNLGYKNQPSLRSLEQKFGTKWRKGRIAKSAQRRKKVIEFIESEAKRFGNTYTVSDVVEQLDKYRQLQQKGLFWLYGNLPKALFDDNGSPLVFSPNMEALTNALSHAAAAAAVASNPSNDHQHEDAIMDNNASNENNENNTKENKYEPEHLDPAVTNS